MDKEMFLNLFKSLIRPHVEYATVVWSPVYKKDMIQIENVNGEPGLVDRVLALHVGSRGFDSHRGHISEDFSDPIDQDIRTQWALSWKIVTECRRWCPPYQTGKTVHVLAKRYKHNEDGRTAPGVCGNGSVPLSHSGNVVTRIHTHTHIENVQSRTTRLVTSLQHLFCPDCLRSLGLPTLEYRRDRADMIQLFKIKYWTTLTCQLMRQLVVIVRRFLRKGIV